uniref:Uncharacterized protein n=1 Tax=Romanomermis culicivorax TaxID=13658 RepID=A0A915HP04_ROMCU
MSQSSRRVVSPIAPLLLNPRLPRAPFRCHNAHWLSDCVHRITNGRKPISALHFRRLDVLPMNCLSWLLTFVSGILIRKITDETTHFYAGTMGMTNIRDLLYHIEFRLSCKLFERAHFFFTTPKIINPQMTKAGKQMIRNTPVPKTPLPKSPPKQAIVNTAKNNISKMATARTPLV